MSKDRRIAITVAAAVLYLLFAAPWAGLSRSGRRVDTVHSGLVFAPSSTAYSGYELAMGQLFLELAMVCVVVAMAAPAVVSFITKKTDAHTLVWCIFGSIAVIGFITLMWAQCNR